MKLPKSRRKEMEVAATAPGSAPAYPWGLQLQLDTEALKKLGIKDLPDVGAECVIHGVAKVTRVGESASEHDKGSKHVELQITKLGLAHDEDAKAFERGYAKGPKRY